MTVRAWFPTLVYDAPLVRKGAAALNRQLLSECMTIREIDEDGRRWSRANYPGGFTSYNSMNRLHRTSPTFAELRKRLARHVRSFADALEFDMSGRRLDMTDCWVNVMPRHAAHPLHLHPLSTISGTYYVKTPRGASNLRFEDPRLPGFMAAPPRRAGCSDANRTFVRYPVRAGHVILFESWLRHEVGPNTTAEERVSVSFNWNWF
ncbi:MAG: hypothetical protein HMLKMBBP_02302 [Planctomycetes bacterium]|nr:hypothetical protein [Planctomycetota bacterium]